MKTNSITKQMGLCFAAALAVVACAPGEASSAKLETSAYRLTVSSSPATCEILDKRSGITWGESQGQGRLGQATLLVSGKPQTVQLSQCSLESLARDRIIATFRPYAGNPNATLRVAFRSLRDSAALEVSYDADPDLQVQSVSLLESTFALAAREDGAVLVPVREGLLIPADSGVAFTHRFGTYAYEGCHMAMVGLLKAGAAAVVSWIDPYVAVDLRSTTNASQQELVTSLSLRKSAKTFQVRVLGKGDHVSVASAYRALAKDRGWLVPWDQKLKGHPERAKLFGAINYKLWSTLDRRMNEDSSREESVRVNWTFEEAAQVAEHLKNDLKLDKVLFTMGGWIHRGYDNQHPDILPTAPECGGDAAFADCARRVMNLGYLLCLHDNYQDIYRDSPSWDEKYIMRTPDEKLTKGGHWAGGVAYLTCSKMALELAQRPQNLRAVKQLSGANSYFIDTTYAAGLQECFVPAHPLSRADDMKWKQALSDYARDVFGVFGSECGREWAIPHSDFFEGLTGVSGTYYHDANLVAKLGATVVPLFELVYRDCIAMYGKYGYEPSRAAGYVLHHISLGRPLNYHSIPRHLYWKQTVEEQERLGLRPGVAEFNQTGSREFAVRYRWAVDQTVARDYRVFVHFTDNSGAIKFQNDHDPSPAVSGWKPGEVIQGPFTVAVPEGLKGTFTVRMGLFRPDSMERALLQGRDNGERSYSVGRLTVSGDTIEFQPQAQPAATPGDAGLFVKADNGWAAGLHPMDRFVKNTYEILSPLNEITSRERMTSHRFLTADRKVQKTTFGEGHSQTQVIVNGGTAEYRCTSKLGKDVLLPPYGFLVESPTFVAAHVLEWGGLRYASPVMFTLRGTDNRPLSYARKLRIYHAFGDDRLLLGGSEHRVAREALIEH